MAARLIVLIVALTMCWVSPASASQVMTSVTTIARLKHFSSHHSYGEVLVVYLTDTPTGGTCTGSFSLDVRNGKNQVFAAALQAAYLSNRPVQLTLEDAAGVRLADRCPIIHLTQE